MDKFYVSVVCDVYCDWENNTPNYRAYINDELFTERTFIWRDEYLSEILQLWAPYGQYQIRYELVPPFTGNIRVKYTDVKHGPPGTSLHKDGFLRIGYART